MSNTFLKQLYIASAMAFCTQPLWGMENTNFVPTQDKESQKLIQLEQRISQKISENISRGMAILHLSKASEANYGLYIPQETVYHIIATFYRTCYGGPLYYSLEGELLEDRHLLNFKFP